MPLSSKYEIISPLGSGPRATVYRGRHVDLGAEVAIKEYHASLTPNAKRRLQGAIDRWVQSPHDNLLVVRDTDPSRDWVISDLMHSSCGELIARGVEQPDRVMQSLMGCLAALDYLHSERRCLHANIKPTNLLYDSQGRIRLSDGYMIALGPNVELPPPSQGCKYLAPEALGDERSAIGPAADLYCLGFVMLEMLLGPRFDMLFRGVCDDPSDRDRSWIRWHSTPSETAPRVADQTIGVPYELALVIDRLVCKDLLQRYSSAKDALNDLKAATTASPRSQGDWSGEMGGGDLPFPSGMAGGQAPYAPPPPGESYGEAPAAPFAPAGVATGDLLAGLILRPNASVVLRIASGPGAGTMKGLEGTEFIIGDAPNSSWQFSSEQYPTAAGRRIMLRRDANGWMARCDDQQGFIINDRCLSRNTSLRSGDILRMSIDGPDFQFIVQNVNEQPLPDLIGTFLQDDVKIAPPVAPWAPAQDAFPWSGVNPVAPSMADDAAPLPPQIVQPSPPVAARVGAETGIDLSSYAPAPPRSSWADSFNYKNWSKSTQNWVAGSITGVIGLIIFIVLPTGHAHHDKVPPKKPPAATTEKDAHVTTPPAADSNSQR